MIKSNTFKQSNMPKRLKQRVPVFIHRIGTERIAELSNERDDVVIPMDNGYIIWTKTYMTSPDEAFAKIEVSEGDGIAVATIEAIRTKQQNNETDSACMKQAADEAVSKIK